jgi:hypothetical protein
VVSPTDPGAPPPDPREPASCVIRGCFALAIVVPALLVIVLILMTMSRLAAS